MCTLHTNVSSKTPSRSPQGSRPVVGGDSECLAKIEFLNRGGQLFCPLWLLSEQQWRTKLAHRALNWLVSIFVELQALRLFFFFSQLNAILAIVRNGWSFCPTHFCLFTIICPSIPPNKGVPSIQMVILPPEPLSRFRNFESEIVPAIAIMTVQGSWGVGAKMFVRGHDGKDLTPIRPSDWCFRYKLNTHQVYTCIL